MKTFTRRDAIKGALSSAGGLLAACGGGSGGATLGDLSTPPVSPPTSPATGTGSSSLFAMRFDAQTPEQISLYCPTIRSTPAETKVGVRYKEASSNSWTSGHPLLHILPSYVVAGSPEPVVEAFAGAIFDLKPGSVYDIELTIQEPGLASEIVTGTGATRALPPASGASTVFATPISDLVTVIKGLKAGAVLELANGTYNLATSNGLPISLSGTQTQPIYIRGQSREGVILRDTTDAVIMILAASNVVIENMTIQGSGIDSGTNASSAGILFHTSYGVQQNITIRNVTFLGVDRGIKAYTRIDGCLVYQCILRGNNTWDMAYTNNPSSGYPNLTWNDDGICLPGRGNAAWNNTLRGFGDSFAVIDGVMSAAVYFWRNRIEMGGDDAFEADYSTRNIGFYDNYCANTATLLSLDPLWGGPLYCFRNFSVNTIRGPFKWTNQNTGQLIYNNTIVRTEGTSGAGWVQANNGDQRNWSYRNNLLVYRGSSALTLHLNMGADRLDFTHNSWYPDRSFNWPPAGGGFSSLAAARASLPSRLTVFGELQRHVQDNIVSSNPWNQTVTLGASHATEYTAMQDLSLSIGSLAAASGVAIPGITDGFSGTAPDRGAAIAGRALPQFGAVVPPSWVASTPSGTWVEVPVARTLDMVDPVKSPLYNPNYPLAPEWAENMLRQSAVVVAWCGAAYDEGADTMWLGLGGGHADYAGNEVYRCNFFNNAPAWEMVRPPSGAIGNPVTTKDGKEVTGLYSDGRPRATHSYNKWVYTPGVGPVLASHGNTSWAGSRGKRWGLFINEQSGETSFTSEPITFTLNQTDGLASCYDPIRHAIWIIPGNTAGILRYDIPKVGGAHLGTYTAVGPAFARLGFASACYLPGYDCLLIGSSEFSETSGKWLVFDCATGAYFNPVFNGTSSLGQRQGSSQPRWVSALGAVCVWNNLNNTVEITKLTPGINPRTDPWAVSVLPISSANKIAPTSACQQGTFGRFAYSPRLGGFLVFNSTSGPTYFYKL